MDQQRFDDLTKALGGAASRRGMLKVLGGAVVGSLAAAVGLGRQVGVAAAKCTTDASCGVKCLKCDRASGACISNCQNGLVCNATGTSITRGTCTTECLEDCQAPDVHGVCHGCKDLGGCCKADKTCALNDICRLSSGVCGCNPGASCTDKGCCLDDLVCGTTCCLRGQVCCGGKCCAKGQICNQSLQCEDQGQCTPPAKGCQVCIAGAAVACAQGGMCCAGNTCVAPSACPSGCCDPLTGDCCPQGHCVDGRCCPSARLCGQECCDAQSQTCTDAPRKQCCPNNRVCTSLTGGQSCCPPGESCAGALTECCPAGSPRICGSKCCPAGETCQGGECTRGCENVVCPGDCQVCKNGRCMDCLSAGLVCDNKKCAKECSGCQDPDLHGICVPCANVHKCCYTSGQGVKVCVNPSQCPGGCCQADKGVCGCASGCCDKGTCKPGSDDSACGSGGGTCSNCKASGGKCVNGKCVLSDAPCCDSNSMIGVCGFAGRTSLSTCGPRAGKQCDQLGCICYQTFDGKPHCADFNDLGVGCNFFPSQEYPACTRTGGCPAGAVCVANPCTDTCKTTPYICLPRHLSDVC